MRSNSFVGAKRFLALIMMLVMVLGMLPAAQAETSRSGAISNFRVYGDEPAAGEDTFYKVTVKQAGQLTAALTDKSTGTKTAVWSKYYGFAQNVLLHIPGRLIEAGHSYSLDVQLSSGNKVVGAANHTYTIVKPVAAISALSATASFRPAVGEQLSVNITMPAAANVYAYVKKGGQIVAALAENYTCPAGTTVLRWNGSDLSGKMCSAGTYTVHAHCVNAAGTSAVVTASFQITGDASKVISARVADAITSCVLPAQPKDGDKPTFYVNAAQAGQYTLKLKDMNTGASVKLTGSLNAGINAIAVNASAVGGHRYLFQMVEKASGRTIGKAQMEYTVTMDPPSLTISAPTSLKAGYGAAMPISYTSGTSGTVLLYVMDTTHKTIYARFIQNRTVKGSGTVYWDGCDSNGNLLPNGTYHVVAEAHNSVGHTLSNIVELKYTGKVAGLSAPLAAGAITLFAPADEPVAAEYTPVRFRVQTTSGGSLQVTVTNSATNKTNTVYKASVSAGMNTITIPADYLSAGTYTVQASLKANKKIVGKAVAYVQPFAPKPQITGFAPSDGFVDKWTPMYTFSFDSASAGSHYVNIEDWSGNVVRRICFGEYHTAGNHTYSWDGKNNAGSFVPYGKYRLVFNYVDRYGAYSNTISDIVEFEESSLPDGVYDYAVVGLGDHKTEIHMYDKPNGTTIGKTYGKSAVFEVLEDRGEWLKVRVSGMKGGPEVCYVKANRLQKIAITSPYRIEVNIARTGPNAQTLFLYKDDVLVDQFKVSTGMYKGTTPTGKFTINHRKPYFKVLGGGGICYDTLYVIGGVCIHRIPMIAGSYKTTEPLLGTVASHGCIRVPISKSTWLYENIPDTTPVIIYSK